MPNQSLAQGSAPPAPEDGPAKGELSAGHSQRLRKNIAALSVLQLLNYTLPVAVVPYLVRVLGPAHYGLLVFAQATLQYANSITDYGFNLSATRLVARHRGDRDALAKIFWSTMAAKVFLMVCCFSILGVLLLVVPMFRDHAGLFIACSGIVLGNVIFPMWFFQGMEEMKAITIAQASAKLLLIPAVFILVTKSDQFVRAALIQSGVYVLAGLIGIPLMWRITPMHWVRPGWRDVFDALREGWHVFISMAAILVYTSTNTLVLGFVSGPVQVGYFGAADRITKAAGNLMSPVTQALYPHLNSLAVESKQAAMDLIRKSLIWIGVLSAGISLAFLAGAPLISHIVLGHQYDGSILPLRWMALLPFVIGLSGVFGVQTMLTFGMNKEFNRIVSSSAALNLLLTIPLAKFYGAAGAAAAVLLTECFVTIAMFWKLRSVGILFSSSAVTRSEPL
jgi:O-antigen/teichoic acid export membrane protein